MGVRNTVEVHFMLFGEGESFFMQENSSYRHADRHADTIGTGMYERTSLVAFYYKDGIYYTGELQNWSVHVSIRDKSHVMDEGVTC
jgi:hypothetical protein